MRRTPAACVSVCVLLLAARDTRAQGVGFSGGTAIDPSQVFVGSYIESAAIGGHLRLRPGVDGAFGGDVARALIDFAFLYEVDFGPLSQWFAYQGSGPTVAIARANGDRQATAGFLGLFGIGNNGFFFEVKVSGGGGPSLRVGVGYTVRRHQP